MRRSFWDMIEDMSWPTVILFGLFTGAVAGWFALVFLAAIVIALF